VGKVFLAGEVAKESSSPPRCRITNGTAENRVLSFQLVQEPSKGHRGIDLKPDLFLHARQVPEVIGQRDTDHCRV
jgi:hypothetical protein